MKNLYIRPAGKGKISLLHFAFDKKYMLSEYPTSESELYQSLPQFVYIVADDQILVHDFVYDTYRDLVLPVPDGDNMKFFSLAKTRYKKIVLTNDTDLQDGGVKGVTTSFLSWIERNSEIHDFIKIEGTFTKGEHAAEYIIPGME